MDAHSGLVGVCLHILTSQQNHGSITDRDTEAWNRGADGEGSLKDTHCNKTCQSEGTQKTC